MGVRATPIVVDLITSNEKLGYNVGFWNHSYIPRIPTLMKTLKEKVNEKNVYYYNTN